mgnify:CR=1 FL=1
MKFDAKTFASCESNTTLLLQQITECNTRNDQCQNDRGTCQGKLDTYTNIQNLPDTPENATCTETLIITTAQLQFEQTLRTNQSTEYVRCNAEYTKEKDKNTNNMIWALIGGILSTLGFQKWRKKEGIGGRIGDTFTGRPPGAPPI